MKEPHWKGIANRPDPESCAGDREAAGEAFDRGTSRPAIELRNQLIRRADLVDLWGRQHGRRRHRKPSCNAAESKTLCMLGNSMRENRETLLPPAVERWRAGGRKR